MTGDTDPQMVDGRDVVEEYDGTPRYRLTVCTRPQGGSWLSQDVFEVTTDDLDAVLAWSRRKAHDLAPARVVIAVVHPSHNEEVGLVHRLQPLCSTRLLQVDST